MGGGGNGDICYHSMNCPIPIGINMYSRNTVYAEISFAEGKSERILWFSLIIKLNTLFS